MLSVHFAGLSRPLGPIAAVMLGSLLILVSLAPASYSAPAPSLPDFLTLEHWEYPIGPHVHYHSYSLQADQVGVRVLAVRASPHELWHWHLSLPQGSAQGRQSVIDQALAISHEGHRVIAGINGDFFSTEAGYRGISLGLAIQDGQLVRHPTGPALAILADGQVVVGYPEWVGMVRIFEGDRFIAEYPLSGVNTPRCADQLVLFSPWFGQSTHTNPWGREVVLATPGGLPPSGSFSSPVLASGEGGDTPLSPQTTVLSGHGTAAAFLDWAQWPHREIQVSWSLRQPWHAAVTAVAGGPILLQAGVILPHGLEGAPAPHQRTPRSAIAVTAENELLLVAVDGRQPGYSLGLTLPDFALLLENLGAVHALNLDGGGSTTLVVRELGQDEIQVANRPSDGRPRAVGNSLMLVSRAPRGPATQLYLTPVAQPLLVGSTIPLSVRGLDAGAHLAALPPGSLEWTCPEQLGSFADGSFTAHRPGTGRLVASLGTLVGDTPITVLEVAQVARVQLHPAPLRQEPGEAVALGVTLYDPWDRVIHASAPAWTWEVEGPVGTIEIRDGGEAWWVASAGEARGALQLTLGERRLSWPVTVGDPAPFADIRGHWSEEYIRAAALAGRVHGYPDATFRPDQPITRGEFIQLAVAFLPPPRPALGTELPFSDSAIIAAWLEPALAQALANGWITGFEDGSFRAQEPMARQAATAVLMRALGEGDPTLRGDVPFEDAADISPWAWPAVLQALELQLVRGFEDNTFRPHAEMTRAQTVTLLLRAMTVPAVASATTARHR